MHAFFRDAIHFELLYCGFYSVMFRNYIYKNLAVYLSDSRVTLFCKIRTFGSQSTTEFKNCNAPFACKSFLDLFIYFFFFFCNIRVTKCSGY